MSRESDPDASAVTPPLSYLVFNPRKTRLVYGAGALENKQQLFNMPFLFSQSTSMHKALISSMRHQKTPAMMHSGEMLSVAYLILRSNVDRNFSR
nr:hypothetical protein HmN_000751500 [Hymenolepis microstoma]